MTTNSSNDVVVQFPMARREAMPHREITEPGRITVLPVVRIEHEPPARTKPRLVFFMDQETGRIMRGEVLDCREDDDD